MNARGKWQGMWVVARFNWPLYLMAFVMLGGSLLGLILLKDQLIRLGCLLALAGSAYFIFVSLGVSHWIYDRSDLYGWKWLKRALPPGTMRRAVFCHTGFDEASAAMREKCGDVQWQVLDHFDAAVMTEKSIRRARKLFPPSPGTLPARHDHWPLADKSVDAVVGLLAIHELRSENERIAWFVEARRCLQKDGRLVLVEHVRDLANFFAFGPGFVHFHSQKSWQHCWAKAGFQLADQINITPFVRVFVLTHHD